MRSISQEREKSFKKIKDIEQMANITFSASFIDIDFIKYLFSGYSSMHNKEFYYLDKHVRYSHLTPVLQRTQIGCSGQTRFQALHMLILKIIYSA